MKVLVNINLAKLFKRKMLAWILAAKCFSKNSVINSWRKTLYSRLLCGCFVMDEKKEENFFLVVAICSRKRIYFIGKFAYDEFRALEVAKVHESYLAEKWQRSMKFYPSKVDA